MPLTILAASEASAVPTIAGQNIETPVRIAISDNDSTNYEWSVTDLTSLLANAVDYYSRFQPYEKEVTITTVNAQADYAIPSDCVHIIDAPYRPWPGLSGNYIVNYFNALYGTAELLPIKDWRDRPLTTMRQELARRFEDIGAGAWEQLTYTTSYSPTAYVRLYPTPTRDGDTFTLSFTANHPLQNNDYFTIKPYHFELVRKLLVAEVLEAKANKLDATANEYYVGATRFNFGDSSKNLRLRAETLREEVRQILSNGAVGHG